MCAYVLRIAQKATHSPAGGVGGVTSIAGTELPNGIRAAGLKYATGPTRQLREHGRPGSHNTRAQVSL